MKQAVTLIFDIGKTNKKLFLFDGQLNEIHREYTHFDEIVDDDGFPAEDLDTLSQWVLDSTAKYLNHDLYDVTAINFSTYGASMVHLDENGKVIAPFYNYLKPFPEDLKERFFESYHGEANFSLITASPSLGFLNSGLQLFYLKYHKPDLFKKIHQSLHFPQYVSYLLTKKYVTDYTSLGCHTGLWDFRNNTYGEWVVKEGFEPLLAPVCDSSQSFDISVKGKTVRIGVGVHDSSSALLPYIQSTREPFVLISTGTWSICMNFFNDRELTKEELHNDCLNFLGIKGHSVKASRLFLGQEISDQIDQLNEHFQCDAQYYKDLQYDPGFVPLNKTPNNLLFHYSHLNVGRFGFSEAKKNQFDQFENFEEAYHQLLHELTELQIASLRLAIGSTSAKDIYVDGGFATNQLFTQMLAKKLPEHSIYSTEFGLGSALGAALLVNFRKLPSDFLSNNYRLKIHHSQPTAGLAM